MMFHTAKIFRSFVTGKNLPDPQFTQEYIPVWRRLDKIGHSSITRLLFIAFYITFYIIFAPSAWWYLLIPVHIVMLPLHGAVINWFAHKYGTTNFKMKNTSRNLYPMDILLMGEAYHNNHHKNPSATNFGFRWYELDPTYLVIRLINSVKIIRIHKLSIAHAIVPVASKEMALTQFP